MTTLAWQAFARNSGEHYRPVVVAHVVQLRTAENDDIQHAA
eukprot:CAMPEP_0177439922 /NCGR_PEP_ID=MMETSP0369-20130122/3574_1 /TAXON_ID=447022 ORGANISM="Scrippsiella hangoei-like, Strain SHHI-4" /NCGR_SAMPLE_ID=MMETSP0369 /ASSEMBLY_ACC=CAM_ASM_000364 /LENGTH=40 /DNA_ID= /DNA_START= /DNA_END= /DNA_ORIENTATION=